MKKVGFIDYYLDEWHANKYPAWIKEKSGGEFEVCYAYAEIEKEGKRSNRQWAEENGIELLNSIEELIKKSDCIVVLAPDDPRMHYELSKDALATGKPVFIDKTFSLTLEDGAKMLSLAEQHHSPCFSTSALRFSEALQKTDKSGICEIVSVGVAIGAENYLIHQLEPIAVLMGMEVEKVHYQGDGENCRWDLVYRDGRTAAIHFMKGWSTYALQIKRAGVKGATLLEINDFFWDGLMDSMLAMFRTGEIAVPHSETLSIIRVLEGCLAAQGKAGEWILL
ncbi:MAG: Gfo/Idh/MocA family oxidoreductase [Clostridia bacterium]|nr:Gfo/Idh/MocA family oxidoreductase [Clostridia bacterium]